MDKNITLSEEALRKKLGTREPIRGAEQRPGPNWERKAPVQEEKQRVSPINLKKALRDREEAAGLKCGGKVRRMAAGGSVRGVGCATKGTKFKGSY